jgi:hypothetical protein
MAGRIWNMLFPPRLHPSVEEEIVRTAEDTTRQANKLADTLEKVVETARADHTHPFAVLLRQVKSASFRDQVLLP